MADPPRTSRAKDFLGESTEGPQHPTGASQGPVTGKEELDDLRVQVQFLRCALVEREAWWSFLARRLRVAVGRAADIIRRTRLPVTRPPSDYHPGFRPYRVRASPRPTSPRCRVLHAVANVGTGGSTRIIVDLMEHLPPGFHHELITRRRLDVEGYIGLRARHFTHLSSHRPIGSVIRKLRPDIVHIHYVAGDPRLPWGETDWRWYHHVFRAAEQEGCCVVENVNIPVPPYVSEVVRRYVYVSDYVAERFGRQEDPNSVIYPGSDTEFFTAKPGVELPDDSIGMVYRLQWDKLDETGIDPFIKTVCDRTQTRAFVIGGGELLPLYESAVARAGLTDSIEFPGYVSYEDLPDWYSRLGVFIAPVVRESFGQVVPFAMSMGVPVVGYRVGALPEIIGDDELLVPPGDSTALADLTAALLDDRPRRLAIGRRNRTRAIERFSLPAMVERYSALYGELRADLCSATTRSSRSARLPPVGREIT